MHRLHRCTLNNSETMEPLTWSRVCPSHCCKSTHMCSHVLCCHYLRSVNIRHSNQLLMLSFRISTYQRFSPYLLADIDQNWLRFWFIILTDFCLGRSLLGQSTVFFCLRKKFYFCSRHVVCLQKGSFKHL